MKLLSIISFLLALITAVTAVNIECRYASHKSDHYGHIYACVAVNLKINSSDTAEVEAVTGKHEENKTNQDVNMLYIVNSAIHVFPIGIEKFFKNLVFVGFGHCELKEIHQSDLKSFPKAKVFLFDGNEIEILEKGLFDFNPKLEIITINNNKIKEIHPDVFENLDKLEALQLQNNSCINMSTRQNFTLKEITKHAKANCQGDDEN